MPNQRPPNAGVQARNSARQPNRLCRGVASRRGLVHAGNQLGVILARHNPGAQAGQQIELGCIQSPVKGTSLDKNIQKIDLE